MRQALAASPESNSRQPSYLYRYTAASLSDGEALQQVPGDLGAFPAATMTRARDARARVRDYYTSAISRRARWAAERTILRYQSGRFRRISPPR